MLSRCAAHDSCAIKKDDGIVPVNKPPNNPLSFWGTFFLFHVLIIDTYFNLFKREYHSRGTTKIFIILLSPGVLLFRSADPFSGIFQISDSTGYFTKTWLPIVVL